LHVCLNEECNILGENEVAATTPYMAGRRLREILNKAHFVLSDFVETTSRKRRERNPSWAVLAVLARRIREK